jgi:hypothetical protein
MSTLIEERPVSRDPEVTVRLVTEDGRVRGGGGGGGRRSGSLLTTAGLGAIAVAILLVVGAITGLVDVGGWFKGTTTDVSGPVVIKELRNLSEYSAAQGVYQVEVDLDGNVPVLPDFLAGEDVLFRGVGTVDATIDFNELTTDAAQVNADGSVTISLSAPKLGDAALDLSKSKVLSRDIGFFNKIGQLFDEEPGYEHELYVKAEKKISRAAVDSGLVERARTNTEAMLTAFLGRLGFDQVTITWVDPAPKADAAK